MSTGPPDDVPNRPLLRTPWAEIAGRWYAAIRETSFSHLPAHEVRRELEGLVARAEAALVGETFDAAAARAVGVGLVRLGYVHPEALERTLALLGEELPASLPTADAAARQARVPALLGAMAGGFSAEARAEMLQQQDEVRDALIISQQEAAAAEEARRVEEAAGRMRMEVLNAAAHDLGGPMTVILGQAGLLVRQLAREPPPTVDWLRARIAPIEAGARRMAAIIDELLDVAQLQAGHELKLDIELVNVSDLLGDVVRLREAVTGAEESPVVVLASSPGPFVTLADGRRLARVLDNILANAIKYSPEGTPVHVELSADAGSLTIRVRDHGVGIPADELPRLFTPFYRASTARGRPGIGLGLAGARRIIAQHGGMIQVESAVGVGTTVTITLPRAAEQ